MKRLSILYITHNGIADHIGQSQVAPYLIGLAGEGHRITLVSAEKPGKEHIIDKYVRLFRKANIDWHYIPYHNEPPIVSTLWDVYRMQILADRLIRKNAVSVTHCRGYLPSLIGLHFKRKKGIKFIFDMRGFWPDESMENGRLNVENNIAHKVIYNFFKKKEKAFLEESDHIVSLTEAGKRVLQEWAQDGLAKITAPITIIPCCADFELFDTNRLNSLQLTAMQQKLGLVPADFVLIYLGSLSATPGHSLYLLDEMLDFYRVLLDRRPETKFLIVANNDPEIARVAAIKKGLDPDKLIITSGAREEMPYLIAQSHLSVFFINPSPTRRACSPTKLAELFAMNVPVVSNAGVGDLDKILDLDKNNSAVVTRFEREEYVRVIDSVLKKIENGRAEIRENSSSVSLDAGVKAYNRIYEQLGNL